MRFLLTTLLLLSSCADADQEKCKSGSPETTKCLADEATLSANELKIVLNKAKQRALAEDAKYIYVFHGEGGQSRESFLTESQKSWEAYFEKQCRLESYPSLNRDDQSSITMKKCEKRLIEIRIEELKNMRSFDAVRSEKSGDGQ